MAGTVLEQEIEALKSQLARTSAAAAPGDWARLNVELGDKLLRWATPEFPLRAEDAWRAYWAALDVQDLTTDLVLWARTVSGVGNAWTRVGRFHRSFTLLRKAAGMYQVVLKRLQRADDPRLWSFVQVRLGEAMADFGRCQPAPYAKESIQVAIEALDAAAQGFSAQGLEREAASASLWLDRARTDLVSIEAALRAGSERWELT